MEGLSNEQKRLLKPRDRNKSEEERWKTIYKICFPNDEFIPSPCKSTCIASSRRILTTTDYIYYSRETAELRRDVFAIVEEETRSVDGIIRDRLRQRLQHAFDNAQATSGLGASALPTPSSGDSPLQPSMTADPSQSSPLATRSAAASENARQARTTVELGQILMTEDPMFGQYLRLDDDSLFLD